MQIGDLAAKAGVTPRTIRYYEELGIVEPEERTGGGFRLYSESQLRRLQIVQSLKDLGFDLQRIRQFFNLKNCSESSGGVASALVDHLVEQERQIDERIRQYMLMKERNQKAIEILNGCLCCTVKTCERDCHHCSVYQEHDEVPDLIECAIYES
jgi:MerR family Zn(II)-responsive transcriptional regulator of zntA